MGAEIRGFKAQRSGRESYGDNAIGYVQVKREGHICIVNAKVTPETNVRNKAYNVDLHCDESEGNIVSVQCRDCAASSGGCKHAIALLMWLHRRSEEPSVTSTQSYWKKSNLSCIGSSVKFVRSKDLVKNYKLVPLNPADGSFRSKVLQKCETVGRQDSVLSKFYQEENKYWNISIHHLFIMFNEQCSIKTPENFLDFCGTKMNDSLCLEAKKETTEQTESHLWYHLRFGRVTASKAHEASRCQTMDGSLVELILGSCSIKDTAAMERGRRLEKEVRKVVEKERNIKINLCGFGTLPEIPIMGASPDGITENLVIEIKCPFSQKTIESYIKNNELTEKCHAQILMQMHFLKRNLGLFCVASPDFETTKEVTILEVPYDEAKSLTIIEKATTFWKKAVFPILSQSY